jgi:hypothetical protein
VIDSALQREVAFRFAGCESECCGASLSIRLLDGPLIGVSVFRVSKGGDGHSAILSHVHSGASASFFHTPSHLYIHTPDMSVVGRAGECGWCAASDQIRFDWRWRVHPPKLLGRPSSCMAAFQSSVRSVLPRSSMLVLGPLPSRPPRRPEEW